LMVAELADKMVVELALAMVDWKVEQMVEL
jgi:hypothetical protein